MATMKVMSALKMSDVSGIKQLTPTGAEFLKSVSEQELLDFAAQVGLVSQAWGLAENFYIGDLMMTGEDAYGDEFVEKVEMATGKNRKTLANFKWVSGSVPSHIRRANLSWSHHREVAQLPEKQQVKVLDGAEEKGLNVTQTRELVLRLTGAEKKASRITAETQESGDDDKVLTDERKRVVVDVISMQDVIEFLSTCSLESLDAASVVIQKRRDMQGAEIEIPV